jgi:cysteine synthase
MSESLVAPITNALSAMRGYGLERSVVDRGVRDKAVATCRDHGVRLPTFSELASPETIPPAMLESLRTVDPDARDARNLFRVHWNNADDRRSQDETPAHVTLPSSITGVEAQIVVALADRFPMISSHKVLAAYSCLAPRLITGQFDPSRQRAVWPSTGNYCRGGVAISRIMGCRGIAVLPEGMSRERFEWLAEWVEDPGDVVRTSGSESNVREIYDYCAELALDPANVVMNQFSEFGNHLIHYLVTGRAMERIFTSLLARTPSIRLAAFVAGTGSAGTVAAGDYLKERFGSRTASVEPLECPTMALNGFGEHNIQGIGDKHIPLIYNVFRSDYVLGVSDRATDKLGVLFNSPVGLRHLAVRRGVQDEILAQLASLGLSAIGNVLAAIQLARYEQLGPSDVVMTVATDPAAMYATERTRTLRKDFPAGFDETAAAETIGEFLLSEHSNVLELSRVERERIFNLGYFTWVEQRDVSIEAFEIRRRQSFWTEIRSVLPVWDDLICEFNGRVGLA